MAGQLLQLCARLACKAVSYRRSSTSARCCRRSTSFASGPVSRIVLDEAHHYLHGADASQLLDLERHGYTVVTYCASRLPKEFLADDAFCRYCQVHGRGPRALVDPRASEGRAGRRLADHGGSGRRSAAVQDGPATDAHVRHREKDVDVPVDEYRAFYFGSNGRPSARRVRTLRSSWRNWRARL